MEGIIAAVITGVLAALASIYASRAANDKTIAVLNERMNSMGEDIARLERKQEEANKVKERVALLEHDGKTLFRRLDEHTAEINDLRKAG